MVLIKVSSVLNRDIKQFGKKFLFDGEEDTCWNSDQGYPQWIAIEFENNAEVDEIQVRFQGGFVGKDCEVQASCDDDSNNMKKLFEFYPEDKNALQIFKLPQPTKVKNLKIVFNNSTDFFGRITIYDMKIIGRES